MQTVSQDRVRPWRNGSDEHVNCGRRIGIRRMGVKCWKRRRTPAGYRDLLHVVDSVAEILSPQTRPVSKQAIAAMTKAGDQVLRRFEGLAKTALKQATTNLAPPSTRCSPWPRGGHHREGGQTEKADLLVVGSRGLSDASITCWAVSRAKSAHWPLPGARRQTASHQPLPRARCGRYVKTFARRPQLPV